MARKFTWLRLVTWPISLVSRILSSASNETSKLAKGTRNVLVKTHGTRRRGGDGGRDKNSLKLWSDRRKSIRHNVERRVLFLSVPGSSRKSIFPQEAKRDFLFYSTAAWFLAILSSAPFSFDVS